MIALRRLEQLEAAMKEAQVENPAWLLRRVLQFGDWGAVHQARLRFGDAAVRQAAAHRSMDPRTRRFWQVVLDAEEEQL